VDPFGLSSLRDLWNVIKSSAEEEMIDPLINMYNEGKAWVDENVGDPLANAYNEGKDALVQSEAYKEAVNAFEDIKKTTLGNDYESNKVSDEKLKSVYDSKYFSSFYGALVIRFSSTIISSFAFGKTIFLNRNEQPLIKDENGNISKENKIPYDTIQHEYGHILQYQALGFAKYLSFVYIPSATYNLFARQPGVIRDNYFNMPWEYNANSRSKITTGDEAWWAKSISEWYFNLIE